MAVSKVDHFKVLMWKNWLLWKRNWVCSVLEILIPVGMCCFFFVFDGFMSEEYRPERSFLEVSPQERKYYPYTIFSDNPYPGNVPPNLQDNVLAHQNLRPWMKNCINGKSPTGITEGDAYRNGHIALAPKNDITEQLAIYIEQQQRAGENYKVQYYDSEDDIMDYVTSNDYDKDICFGVSVNSVTDNQVQYAIHFNTTGLNPDLHDIPETEFTDYKGYLVENIDEYFTPWVDSGFLQLQNWLDNIILRIKSNDPNLSLEFQTTSERLQAYTHNEASNILNGQLATYYVLPIIIMFLRMSYGLLLEKEKKIKEGMKIMGLTDSSFYLSWICFYLIKYTIASLLIALVSCVTIFKQSSYILVFIWYLLYCVTLIFQSIFITTFFTRAKTGNIVAMVFYLALYMSSLSINSTASSGQKATISFFSQNAVNFGADTFLLSEVKLQGIGWGDLGEEIERYTIGTSFIMMIFNALIFGILAFYFDQVFPNEFGKKQHPLFCFPCLIRKRNQEKKQFDKEADAENHKHQPNVEQVDEVLNHKEQNDDALVINNISKVYPNGKKAVSGLSLKMYKDHITCLLGQNGAGKTSTISMLIGMQEFSKGSANVFGFDVEDQMGDLRHIMGFCPQHDILFDSLTCEEHLQLYAAFKGVPKNEIDDQVTQMLADVDLEFKRKDYSKSLSGGQKRRLSVAIAFIGGSKLIYLDEPTSGMDTSARRFIWEMLQKYKQDKIVVLTTHFMDEADFLGDRIAIMSQGELICMGSSTFLKSQFGVGYNLTIVKEDTTVESQPIIDQINKTLPGLKPVSDISAEIQFQLRMEEIGKFQALFDGLDEKKEELKFTNYGISITTMEEVFLRVADKGKDILASNRMSQIQSQKQEQTNKEKDLKQIEQNKDIDNFDLNKVRITNPTRLFINHFLALTKKRLRYFKRDKKGFVCEIVLPSLIVLFGLILTSGAAIKDSPYVTLKTADAWENKPEVLYASFNNDDEVKELASNLSTEFNLKWYEPSGTTLNEQIANFDLQNYKNESEENRGAFFIKEYDTAANALDYFLEISTINRDALPLFTNRINTAFGREVLNNDQFDIKVTVGIFKNTKGVQDIEGAADGFASAIIFSIALSFIPASMIAFTVKEREDQVKHQQLVSGVSIPAYWLSNTAIDMLKYYVPTCVFSISMVAAFNIETFNETNQVYGACAMLFVMYGYSIVPFSYVFGFLFKQYGNAQVSSFFIHFISGGIVSLVFFILRIIESTADVAKVLQWFMRITPSYCFGSGLISLGSRDLYKIIEGREEDYEAFDWDITGGDIMMMGLIGTLSFIGIFVIENLIAKGVLTRMISKEDTVPYKPKPMDGDVEDEMELIEKTQPKDYTVRVNKLRKVYRLPGNRYNEAVDQVSFGIKNGECFTLLGINGAGKTTTFKILSGDYQMTSGEAHINGYSVQNEMVQARKYIGYCPQFDALLDNLTSREHLELYAAIKGIPTNMVDQLIKQKILEMELAKFENVCAGTYSGGNKRKLSVAIAMLGNPPICFLDEPSTGMDPQARRYMWNVISRISTKRKQSSIILTTHSMEEAEALSTKIAIMVTGQLKCIGSIQHIKSKFGKGYEVELKLVLPTEEEINQVAKEKGLDIGQIFTNQNFKETLPRILATLGRPDLMEIITEKEAGVFLLSAIRSKNGLEIKTLISYILIEGKGDKVKQFISQEFGKYSIIEHFQAFYRFKIETNVATGKIFGAFENNKQNLDLASYNVKQATIEQIFNMFAKNQIETITKAQEKQKLKQVAHSDEV